ncbi:MAG: toprim domain-containing protein [Desulfitobacteriia bacterium]|jgi:toprim domain protein
MAKAIIVEGKTDRERLLEVLDEPVNIIMTHGTISISELESFIDEEEYEEVYVLIDADHAGNNLRKEIKRLYPNFRHLYTRRKYREVATTPLEELAKILSQAHFLVKEFYY